MLGLTAEALALLIRKAVKPIRDLSIVMADNFIDGVNYDGESEVLSITSAGTAKGTATIPTKTDDELSLTSNKPVKNSVITEGINSASSTMEERVQETLKICAAQDKTISDLQQTNAKIADAFETLGVSLDLESTGIVTEDFSDSNGIVFESGMYDSANKRVWA